MDSQSQSVRDVDRIIAELDYGSFELLPGTVNPRPGMRYIEYPAFSNNFIEDSEQSEDPLDFRTGGVLFEDVSDGVGGFVPYLVPISAPCWIVENLHDGEKKKKKNKKKRHKNRQRQRKHQLHQLQTQDVSPPSPDISDGNSTDSPANSPIKFQPTMGQSPEQIGKNRRRSRGSGRGRRLFPNYGIDFMGIHLNPINLGGPDRMYRNPDPYSIRIQQNGGPNYFNRPDML